MAQIPDYTALGPTPTPTPSYRRPLIDESARGVDEALAGFGGAAMHVGDALHQKAQADAATWASNQLTDFRVATLQAMQEAQAKAPDDAHGFTPGVLADFDKRASALTGVAAENPLSSQFLEKAIPSLRAQVAEDAMRWEAGQRTAYRAQSVLDNTTKLAPLVQADPSQRLPIGAQLLTQIDAAGLEPDQRTKLKNHVISELAVAGASGDAQIDPAGTQARLNDPNDQTYSGLSLAQREQLRQKANGQLAQNIGDPIVNTYRSQGPTAGAAALNAVDSLQQPDDVKAQIYQHVEKGLSQWHQEAQQTHAKDIMGLESRLASGQTTPGDVNQVYALHNQGVFTAEQAGSMIGRIQKGVLDKIPDTTYRDYVAGAVSRGQGLDPTDKELRKGMDAAFQEATQGQPPGSPGWINRGADMARRTGIVPDSMIAWSRTQLVSGDPATAASAAQTISRLSDADPRGLPYAMKEDKESASMAKMINDAVTAGADPKTAVENARAVINMPDAQKEALNESYRKNKVAASSLMSLVSRFSSQAPYKPGFMQAIPPIPPAMLGQYEELRQDYYKTTGGNIQQASDLAQANLKNVWGISEVNGKREFMMYAPEAQNVGLTTQSVQEAMRTFVAAQAGVKPELADPNKIHLTPSVETATTNGQKWNVSVPDQFGAYGPLLDERNNPLVFTLPTATQMLKSQATADIFDKMESTLNQQKLDNEGNAWLHEGLLKEQMEEDRIKNANPKGQAFVQGRRGGY